MRTITLIVLHCSATPMGSSLSFEECRRDHRQHRGFRDIGYHYYITRDGIVHQGRSESEVGAHCRNHNRHSIGVCYEGGLDKDGKPADTRTAKQMRSMDQLLKDLQLRYPKALVVGHRVLNPTKSCPGF